MATRIRTLNFLPDIFKTPANTQFLQATLDQLVDQPNLMKIEGYVGSKFGYGIDATKKYVVEPTKTRVNYQLDPGVTFLKQNSSTAQDFISYPGIIDALALQGGVTDNNDRLFTGQFYSWDSFTDLDKLINFNQYYWLPAGLPQVTVAVSSVFDALSYVVIDNSNGYNIASEGSSVSATNPTITLLRGGVYTFAVNQPSQFWIQGEPGVTGFSKTQPNLQTRDVLGVENNGENSGLVTFTVPGKDAQSQYNFPGNNPVDLVTNLPFNAVNGALVSTINNIDGVTALDGRTLMFFNTGVQEEQGYISTFFDQTNYDSTTIITPITITVTGTAVTTNKITCNSTASLLLDNSIVFTGTTFGGLAQYSTLLPNTIYYIKSIDSLTEFKVSLTPGGPEVVLSPASGTAIGHVNIGLYEEGFFTEVSSTFYTVTYVGDYGAEVIRLVPAGVIPNDQKITAIFGTQYSNRNFYRDSFGQINLIPYLSAVLDTLYYQDGTASNKVGKLKIIDSNLSNTLNILDDIIGHPQYTAPNGVVFTNGLIVSFTGDIYPASYENIPFYVEGVGTGIELVPVDELIAAEIADNGEYVPFDSTPYDVSNFDSSLYVPVSADYITIARNSMDRNAWSRSNRWFHIDVIKATATYNQDPTILSTYTDQTKAKRPIIEFQPNLRLFQSGVLGKKPVDFIDYKTTDAFTQVEGKTRYFPDVSVTTAYTATLVGVTQPTLTTTVTVPLTDVTGTFIVGQYIVDSDNLLPANTIITAITGTTLLTLTLTWTNATYGVIPSTTGLSLSATVGNSDNFSLFDGARVIFATDTNPLVRNNIYTVRLSTLSALTAPVITLTASADSPVQADELTFVFRGNKYSNKDFYFDGSAWLPAQQKSRVNQPPLFDVADHNGVSFGDQSVYTSSSFAGSTLFSYGAGAGGIDAALGFPIRYSSIDNVGDISFDVSLNSDVFNYVNNQTPMTLKVNTGYVHDYYSRIAYTRKLGWKTAIAPSVQNQVFDFNYVASTAVNIFVCDVAAIAPALSKWPTVQVYVNNVAMTRDQYTVSIGATTTSVTLSLPNPEIDTIVQVLVLSDQVSSVAYYEIPINLNNNPLNTDVATVNVGDIRRHYQSIFSNAPNTVGEVLGANNYRDAGDLLPYGTAIVQNSTSLVLPGSFLRKQNHNLFDALLFNNREYINFKTLLMHTINTTEYSTYPTAQSMLDAAMDQITLAKTADNSFFWSDMLPSKAAYITNKYSFANSLDTSIYPLSRIYDYSKANYFGIIVYVTRVVSNVITVNQLIRGVDYEVSTDSPSLTITTQMLPGDRVDIREYNQTYGSYVPNTPTKLGLYPATIPEIRLDSNYSQPTYFIVGHDGSFTKLYGAYNAATNVLSDFRDQVLLEFELRVYNNIKVSAEIPLLQSDVMPGFFRDTGYSTAEINRIYSSGFLNWIGQNRIEYQIQHYTKTDEFSFNYYQSQNKLNGEPIEQGNWRGLYDFLYDTTDPNTAPWEMLGFKNKPTWFDARYGVGPYTSENTVLWTDLSEGINWNNGFPVVIPTAVRPGLLSVLPVDSAGNLVSPFVSVVGNYINQTFNRDWKVGDQAPAEFSYRRSSSWPFDLMRIFALTKPAQFFNLASDLDTFKYNAEFDQYLVNDRSHLVISDIEIYGTGVAKTSYFNWIVDYEQQVGIPATQNITDLLDNIDVRLVYRLAGFSDKNLLKFYVEKSTANSNNNTLLIPDESYAVLLYDNQPFNKIVYSGVVAQISPTGYKVFGSSQTLAYFKVRKPIIDGHYSTVKIENLTVQLANHYSDEVVLVPYGTEFSTVQEVGQFLVSYGSYLVSQGMKFDQIIGGLPITWSQMVAEFLYWAQTGWEVGSILNINPAADVLNIDKDNYIVQPLTLRQQNFILNQNLYPIAATDLSVVRDGTSFTASALNQGDSINYGEFNISNFEHGIVFDNITVFGDRIYNLITGLRQDRIVLRGRKTAEWNGTIDAQGFILNQDNIKEWNNEQKYTTGSIVTYKNRYWIALVIVQASEKFEDKYWKQTDYNEIQKGLLPNPSTRSYESTIYYDSNKSNLDPDADLLSFSLIGYRPRDYLAVADLTDITQVNVYKNLIKGKGTPIAANAFKGATLSQGGIDYTIYENWAIKTAEFGGVLNSNFAEFRLKESVLSSNPCIVGLTNGVFTAGVQQEVPMYSLFNYGRPISTPNILSTLPGSEYVVALPSAGYVNYNDVKMSAYYYSDLTNNTVPLSKLYVTDYIWLADYQGSWQVSTPNVIGQVIIASNLHNGKVSITFDRPHSLSQYECLAIVSFDTLIDGFYTVASVINANTIQLNLSLNDTVQSLTGQGIAFTFDSSRVATPSDIAAGPVLDTEFTNNTIWVDTNTDGDWAVYRKAINYEFGVPLTRPSSLTLGSAVAHTSSLGYLIGDASLGQVYRYQFNELYQEYQLVQTITGTTSFGSTITYAGDTFVVSTPTGTPTVKIYDLVITLEVDSLNILQTISAPGGVTNWGSATALSGDKNWLFVSDTGNNSVHAYHKSVLTGLYEASYIIDGDALSLTTSGDNFGHSISTDYYGDTVAISAPNKDYSATIDNWGYTYVFDRTVQKFEASFTSIPNTPQLFNLAWAPVTVTTSATATAVTTNLITCTSTTGFVTGMPVIFSGTILSGSGLAANTVYYILSGFDATHFSVSTTRGGTPVTLANASGTMVVTVQSTPLTVSVNGTQLADNTYACVATSLHVIGSLTAGDIITVGGNNFALAQTLTTEATPTVGVQFGTSVDMTSHASEIIVGAPFALSSQNQEGAVFRFTNGGGKYGTIIGSSACSITAPLTLLLNGYSVTLPTGGAVSAADAINQAHILNVQAYANPNPLDSDFGILTISLIDTVLAGPNDKLQLTALTNTTTEQLGIKVYTHTQVINDPHSQQTTQFGTVVKFNESDSFVVSAPTSTRFVATTFDFTNDLNNDNDLMFDNNSTRWVDTFKNAGAVYMFDYLGNYNESLATTGKFAYAQCINDISSDYGAQPMFGQALDFNDNQVVVGTPNFRPSYVNGQVVTYTNSSGNKDWSVYRSSSPIVDINRMQDIQLFSASTNTTLDNLDYIDPLSGKLLGAAMENIDIISNVDPAGYTTTTQDTGALVWGANKVGHIWFNTSTTKFVNYHQNDAAYNSQYWGTVFPGSKVTVYSWVNSSLPPSQYAGQGTPYDITTYTTEYYLNASGALAPTYFFWVRNTNIIFSEVGKTLADSIIQTYIANPLSSGISYMAPLSSDVFALYNCGENINDIDTVLHIGFSSGTSDDVGHELFNLIRDGYVDDFIPGLPSTVADDIPSSLYNKMLDSMCGVDVSGAVVPNPYLPKAVQYGIYTRPNQSFFVNRYNALKNYLTYANTVLAQYPIAEIKQPTFLFASGTDFDTTQYWTYITWWAAGYNDNTKAVMQVPIYADLATLKASVGLIVTVEMNGNGQAETYVYDGAIWNRIGLQNGTIQFKSGLWDYASIRVGFGDSFFDTTPYSEFPSAETRNIIRALTEEIYTGELLIHRNKSLILLFEFIQSETIESQNYLPWLNKTSFIDVSHTIRELLPITVYQSDNQQFLSGYLNEVKPYHVVIKEFLFKYNKTELYAGDITDFDLPSAYNTSLEQFISPELVYQNPSMVGEYLPSDTIWQEGQYKEWAANHGLSLVGIDNYLMTTLSSYMVLNTSECYVENAYGFPVTGTIQIDEEQISYSSVDREMGMLHGLSRGGNGTAIAYHLPGAQIYINLPPILLLDSGRGYSNPPKVEAWIDTSIYPAPTRPAVLEAVMQFDAIMRIDVIDPGAGYATTPEIRIAPSDIISFNSTEVQTTTNTIRIYSTTAIQTGDVAKYYTSANAIQIGGLQLNQHYYVGVLDITPTLIIALYPTYADAVNDKNRIVLSSTGSGNNYLQLGGIASCVTTALPIRENQITLRFDRTSYSSEVIEWVPGSFYSAFYAGLYNNSAKVSSSSISLEASKPPIDTILASAQGAAFALLDVTPIDTLSWSSSSRLVTGTLYPNLVEIAPGVDGAPDNGTVGPTLGFYLNMPVKFAGPLIGGITADTIYYVVDIVSETQFRMSLTVDGAPVSLTTVAASSVALTCYVGARTLGTTVTFDYPGISEVTSVTNSDNSILVPLTGTGQNGTTGYFIGLPVIFTGTVLLAGSFIVGNSYKILTSGDTDFKSFGATSNTPGTIFVATNVGSGTGTVSSMFGGLVENDQYYITTIIDSQTFTVSTTDTPTVIDILGIRPQVTATASATTIGTNIIQCNGVAGFAEGLPIIFSGTVFGGITADIIYYIKSVDFGVNQITISATPGGTDLILFTASGIMAVAVNMVLVCTSTISLHLNEPVILNNMLVDGDSVTDFGNIISGVRYFVSELYLGNTSFSVSPVLSGGNMPLLPEYNSTPGQTQCLLTSQSDVVQLTTGIGSMNITAGLPISPGQINGQQFTLYESSQELINQTGTNISLISRSIESAQGSVTVIGTQSGTNLVTIFAGHPELTANDQITLTGTGFGGLSAGTYYIKAFSSYNTFTVSATRLGGIAQGAVTLSTASGSMTLADVDNPVTLLNRLGITTLSGALTDMYVNMPIQVATSYGGLTGLHTYYIKSSGQVATTVTNTSSSGDVLTCDSTVGFYPNMRIIFTGTILGGLEYGLEYYVLTVLSPTQFTITPTPGDPILTLLTSNGTMIATGETYITVCDTAPGSATMTLTPTLAVVNMAQTPTVTPVFTVSYILGGYRAVPSVTGSGYALNNTILILGANIGGVTPTNNLLITVSGIDSIGQITSVACYGTPNEFVQKYYFKVVSDTQAELYSDALMTIPVDGYYVGTTFPGIKTTTVTGTTTGTNIITVSDSSHFFVNDEVVFTGFTGTFGNLVPGTVYYVLTSAANTLTVSSVPAGAVFALITHVGSCTVSKPGTYLLLPEPFNFDQSIVTFNNRVYQCKISNNDAEFIFGKWLLLGSDSRRLNALDRIVGYYKPTDNMPGNDMTQLVNGIIYPNSTYLGNPFAPEDFNPIDTVLQDQPFYPVEVNLSAIAWDGTTYLAPADTPNYSAVVFSENGGDWTIDKVSGYPANVTDILFANDRYVITTRNPATPLMISNDGFTWATNGEFTPFDSTPYADDQFDVTAINVQNILLNSVTFGNSKYIAVGDAIITSTDTYTWVNTYEFASNGLVNNLNGVSYISVPGYSGYIAVGTGQEYVIVTGELPTTIGICLLLLSPDGISWNPPLGYTTLSSYGFNAVTANDTLIVIVGDNSVRFISYSGSNWISHSAAGTGNPNLNDIIFAAGLFVSIGDNGTIETSSDGITWASSVSGTTENLTGITYNSTASKFVVVGDNNTILSSSNGIVWSSTSVFTTDDPVYSVQGDAFTSGYGPEEMVPGVVTDNLSFTVNTRPGSNWAATEYAHTGYAVVSSEITPT